MSNLKRCEIVTNLSHEGKELFDMNKMKLILASKKCIKNYSYIIHDKDTYTKSDEEKNELHKEGTLKPAHIHLLLRFEDNQPQDTKYIAKWFNLSENFVQRINGRWLDAVMYQTHKNSPQKYQYSPQEVLCNFDYVATIEACENEKNPLSEALNGILSGHIREYNKTLEIDNLLLVQYAQKINEAFKVRSEHLQATRQERQTDVIYITGASGCGKTTLAKKIAKEKNLDYFISSGSNDVMDGYGQQPCLIIDDIRPSVLGLSDLLKLLDNHTASSVKSRYKNKYLNCECIILTTVLDIDTFYNNVFAEHDEPITQLKRRCGTYIRMDMENIYVSLWDNSTMRYTSPVVYKNTLLDNLIPKEKLTEVDVKEKISALIPFLELEQEQDISSIFQLEKVTNNNSVSEDNYNQLLNTARRKE